MLQKVAFTMFPIKDAARARDGRVLLRIEDHDRQRSRPEYEAAAPRLGEHGEPKNILPLKR